MAEGEFALVRQHVEEALKQTTDWVGDHDLYALLIDAAARQRDEAALRQYAPLAEETAARHDHRLYQAIAHRAWGAAHALAGEYAEAEARLDQALALFGSLGTTWQIGRTRVELAELARARSDAASARRHFSRALVEFEQSHAAPDAERVRAALTTLA